MKKINYYAPRESWKVPKWLGVTIGGIFGIIAIGSGLLILQLTRSPHAAPVAALATAPASAAAPVAGAAASTVAAPATAAPAQAATPVSAPEVAESKHHSRHHDHGRHVAAKQAKAAKLAAKKSAPSSGERATILAKHDNKEKRHEKDALDKLLGL